jgi:blue copper oxidase
MKKLMFYVMFMLLGHFAMGQNPVAIPDTLSGTTFNLNLQAGTMSFYPNTTTNTYGANGDILGPTLFLNKGDNVTLNVQNDLPEVTTIHWHGMHISAKNDGGPHTVIDTGHTWSPHFTVLDHAATYWYHPHLHHHTAEHVTKGIAGFIIVRDADEALLTLPRAYGVDDFPLVIQSRAFDVHQEFIVETAYDTVVLVNATKDPYLDAPAQVVRLRLLNGSTERVYNLGFQSNLTFHQIATDGGLLDAPVGLTRLRLAPGERAEILVDLSTLQGQTINLMSFGSELSSGIYGAANPSAMPMGSIAGYSNNPLNGSNFNVLQLNVIAPTTNAVMTIPSALVTNTPYSSSTSNITRSLTFSPAQMGATGMVNGPFEINNSSFDMNVINYNIPLDNTEIWSLNNQTGIAHPFHIHDVQFFILDINGVAPPTNMQGRKDVVLVPAQQTVRFITKFEDFADSIVPYMYHCHMLSHEDDGMMGQFLVLDAATNTNNLLLEDEILIYPNPMINQFQISLKNEDNLIEKIQITDVLGRIIYNENEVNTTIQTVNTQRWSSGIYHIFIKTKDGVYTEKIIRQ